MLVLRPDLQARVGRVGDGRVGGRVGDGSRMSISHTSLYTHCPLCGGLHPRCPHGHPGRRCVDLGGSPSDRCDTAPSPPADRTHPSGIRAAERHPRRDPLAACAVISLGILALAFVRGQWQGCLAVPAGPESPEEVIAIAQRLGLHCCTDCADGRLEHTLYVSYLPIPWRE